MSERGPDGYEKSDVHVASVVRFTIGLTVGVLVSLLVVQGLLDLLDGRARRAAAEAFPPSHAAGDPPHPLGPVLQGAPGSRFPLEDPVREMEALRREQRAKLEGGRLPIGEAKKRLAEQGLPVRDTAGKEAPR